MRGPEIWLFFYAAVVDNVCHTLRGGVAAWAKSKNAAEPLSSIYLIPLWLAILKQPSPCVPRGACRE